MPSSDPIGDWLRRNQGPRLQVPAGFRNIGDTEEDWTVPQPETPEPESVAALRGTSFDADPIAAWLRKEGPAAPTGFLQNTKAGIDRAIDIAGTPKRVATAWAQEHVTDPLMESAEQSQNQSPAISALKRYGGALAVTTPQVVLDPLNAFLMGLGTVGAGVRGVITPGMSALKTLSSYGPRAAAMSVGSGLMGGQSVPEVVEGVKEKDWTRAAIGAGGVAIAALGGLQTGRVTPSKNTGLAVRQPEVFDGPLPTVRDVTPSPLGLPEPQRMLTGEVGGPGVFRDVPPEPPPPAGPAGPPALPGAPPRLSLPREPQKLLGPGTRFYAGPDDPFRPAGTMDVLGRPESTDLEDFLFPELTGRLGEPGQPDIRPVGRPITPAIEDLIRQDIGASNRPLGLDEYSQALQRGATTGPPVATPPEAGALEAILSGEVSAPPASQTGLPGVVSGAPAGPARIGTLAQEAFNARRAFQPATAAEVAPSPTSAAADGLDTILGTGQEPGTAGVPVRPPTGPKPLPPAAGAIEIGDLGERNAPAPGGMEPAGVGGLGPKGGRVPPERPEIPAGVDIAALKRRQRLGILTDEERAYLESRRGFDRAERKAQRAERVDPLEVMLDEAQAGGFVGNRDELRALLEDRIQAVKEIDAEIGYAGANPADLVQAIVRMGGIGEGAETAMKGEIRALKETFKNSGVPGATRLVRPNGLSLDSVRELLVQDPRWANRFQGNGGINELYTELDNIGRGINAIESRPPIDRLGFGRADWWNELTGEPDVPFEAMEDVAPPAAPPIDAEIAQAQTMLGSGHGLNPNAAPTELRPDWVEPPMPPRAAAPASPSSEFPTAWDIDRIIAEEKKITDAKLAAERAPLEDILDTGEAQTRLPGAQDVRKPGIAPTFELPVQSNAPFSLEGQPTSAAAAREAAIEAAREPTFEQLMTAGPQRQVGETLEDVLDATAPEGVTGKVTGRREVLPARAEPSAAAAGGAEPPPPLGDELDKLIRRVDEPVTAEPAGVRQDGTQEYFVKGGPLDRSTVTAETLRAEGIDVPATEAPVGPPPVKPVPANVKSFLTQRLGYSPADVDALGFDEAIRVGREKIVNPNADAVAAEATAAREAPYRQPVEPLPERSTLPDMRTFDETRIARGVQRKGRLQSMAVPPGEGVQPVPGKILKQAEAQVSKTAGAEREAGLSPRERGEAPRQIEQRVRRMKEWIDDPTPENFARWVKEVEGQAEKVNEKQLRAGTSKEGNMPDIDKASGEYLASGFGAFEQLYHQNPAAFRVLMQAGAGTLGGALSDREHPMRGAIFGAMIGAGLTPQAAGVINRSWNKLLNRSGARSPMRTQQESLFETVKTGGYGEMLRRQARGAVIGGIAGAASDDDPVHGALVGMAFGAGAGTITPAFRRQMRYFGMLSGPAQLSNVAGNVGSVTSASAERIVAAAFGRKGGINEGLRMFQRAIMDFPDVVRTTGKRAFHEAITTEPSKLEEMPARGVLSIPGRVMNAADQVTKELLRRGGLSSEEAAYYTYTSKPLTELGQTVLKAQQKSGMLREIVPFAKTSINLAERGIERLPTHLFDIYAGMPADQRALILAQVSLGIGAMTAGAMLGADNKYLIALAGPYAVPFTAGIIGKQALLQGQPIVSTVLHNFAMSVSPISGISDLLDPIRWGGRYVASYVPSILRILNPDTYTGDVRDTSKAGLFGPAAARVPGLAQALPLNTQYMRTQTRIQRRQEQGLPPRAKKAAKLPSSAARQDPFTTRTNQQIDELERLLQSGGTAP